MKRYRLKLQRPILGTLFFVLTAVSPSATGGQANQCVDAVDCRRQSDALYRRAAALNKEKVAKEAELKRRQEAGRRRAEQRRREDEQWAREHPGLGRTIQPLEVDDTKPVQDEIRALENDQRRLAQQAADLEARAQQFGRAQQFDGSPSPPKGRGCFIATAAYGSPMAEDVITLRQFRDKHLLTNWAGRRFVDYYNNYSPPVAEFIASHENARMVVRAILMPIVYSIKRPLSVGVYLIIATSFFWLKIRRKCGRAARFIAKTRGAFFTF